MFVLADPAGHPFCIVVVEKLTAAPTAADG
jgi:hypothetical protein